MESTNLRKWLQVLDVAKELEFGYKSYASWEQLVRADTDVFPVVAFLNPFSVKRSDDRKYVSVRRVGNNKDP